MIIKKSKVNRKNIATYHPITNIKINNGFRNQIAIIADFTGIIEYKLDNKICTEYGDLRNGNYIYQIKSNRCQIKLPKKLNIKAITFNSILNNYIKYDKANRYIYAIQHNDETYEIIMNDKEFKQFVKMFGTYSKSKNCIRIYKSDNKIWNTLQGC